MSHDPFPMHCVESLGNQALRLCHRQLCFFPLTVLLDGTLYVDMALATIRLPYLDFLLSSHMVNMFIRQVSLLSS